ncbi:MAG: hypothetical protein AAF291_10455 [Pseudomonadota bacterium]
MAAHISSKSASPSSEPMTRRAMRFGRRLAGEREPTFADLVRQRKTAQAADKDGERLAMVLALLHAKPALDRALDGARLARLADAIGEDALDAVRNLDTAVLPQEALVATLPQASELRATGQRLLDKATDTPDLAALTQRAVVIVQHLDSERHAEANSSAAAETAP